MHDCMHLHVCCTAHLYSDVYVTFDLNTHIHTYSHVFSIIRMYVHISGCVMGYIAL